jgi:hypothetical protein
MELTLTIEEWELLSEILDERHRALLREISHTDHREFKPEPSQSHATRIGTDARTSPLTVLA